MLPQVSVTVAAHATYWKAGMLYAAGEVLDVNALDANRGKYHGIFLP